jgi:hypothetical protein
MTLLKLWLSIAANIVVVATANAAGPGAASVPSAVGALKGCWHGAGKAVGKQVVVSLSAKPILQNTMFTIDVESSAVTDPKDRYSAHLIFGGAGPQTGDASDDITSFWADSFGGAYTALGQGRSRPDGFDATYPYPDDAYVNRWTLSGGRLTWTIIARNHERAEKTFAAYTLDKVACALASR